MDNTQGVKVNILDATDVVCDKCGDKRFEPVHLMKKLSALMSPDGKEQFIPIGVMTGFNSIWACYACGHINEEFLPIPMRAGAPKQTAAASGIISSVLPDVAVPESPKPTLKLEV